MQKLDEVTSQPRWAPESHYAKEMRKWEKPYRFAKYPQMLYKARKPASGGPYICTDPLSESFSASCQLVVRDDAEFEKALSEGWREGLDEAVAHAQGLDDDIAEAAAYRAHEDRNMSERAKLEAAAADDATAEHVPEVVEQKRRPGRPRKEA